ncbi:uncharacterized protein Dana_GF24418 [Drosophila ananassae]|uniref:Glycoprotein-N-acetylgalactosamine 3-beta-galactosyltransferase 1 n=1 Tax=Drosophila ananassae TaxID=7217 RepID=B3M5E2_DROAN|nr:glycoprotein-N-acetylgalactosamine 3-beta-galactosyltransferase 1 [Drosophila ananassae]EDV39552.1 uncharacterized protein Dana_GF24418 [Drosophila ananassae]
MYRNVLCLVLGLIIGIQLTDLFEYFQLTDSGFGSTAITKIEAEEATPQLLTEQELSNWLYNETRVLCMVLTMPQNHESKASRVKRTWGKRCNKLIFISSQADLELGAIDMGVPEGRSNLYPKIRKAMAYVYKNYGEDYDWFLKADDDTFVIMENLRYFLYPYDPEAALYFGHKFRTSFPQGYMSGGAGYVLSRDALRRLNLFALNNTEFCPLNQGSEDRQIGYCLRNVGVVAGDSRDEEGRERFMPMGLRNLLPSFPADGWWPKTTFYAPQSEDVCSNTAISSHYVKSHEFDMFEFLVYRLKVFGVSGFQKSLPYRLDAKQLENQMQYWSKAKTTNSKKIF